MKENQYRNSDNIENQTKRKWEQVTWKLGQHRSTYRMEVKLSDIETRTQFGEMKWNLVGSILGRSSIKTVHLVPIR
jgi:ribosomal protein L18E